MPFSFQASLYTTPSVPSLYRTLDRITDARVTPEVTAVVLPRPGPSPLVSRLQPSYVVAMPWGEVDPNRQTKIRPRLVTAPP